MLLIFRTNASNTGNLHVSYLQGSPCAKVALTLIHSQQNSRILNIYFVVHNGGDIT